GAAAVETDLGTITSGPTIVDWTNGISQRAKISSNTVIQLTGGSLGTLYTLRLVNDAFAGYAVTFDQSNIQWQNNTFPGISPNSNDQTVFYFYFSGDGTYYSFDEQPYDGVVYNGAQQIVLSNTGVNTGRAVGAFITYDNQKWLPWGINQFGQLGLGTGSGNFNVRIDIKISGPSAQPQLPE